jgi:hypothetical protein
MSTLRRVGISALLASVEPATRRASSQKSDMHFVTSWQTEMSVEQSETKKAVSSLVHAAARSGMSSAIPVSSYIPSQ